MNRHAASGYNETTSRSHHELYEQMGQLVDRELVLISENDQLRAQLVEMKEQEKKKYDDLMVQYRELSANANIKREYDRVDYNGTAANQVTVKTEWDDEDVKHEMKVEIKEEDDQEDRDIFIKHEQLDDQSHNGQQMDNDDPDTNAHNVNIKTEPIDCDFVVVKEEIKEEDDDDCAGCERCLMKKEEVSDDDEVDNDGHGLPIDEVNDEDGVIRGGDNDEVDDEPNVDDGALLSNPSRDNQSASNVNESIEEGGASLEGQEQIANTANQSNDPTQSDDLLSPSTSTGQGSNRIVLTEQETVSTQQKVTKRKQPKSKRTVKRLKQTIAEVGDDEEMDIENVDREEEAKVKVLYLNCTEPKCNVKLNSLDQLYDHLHTVHQILPLQCFATNCNARFDNSGQIGDHIKLLHSQITRFECTVCHKECDSQHKAYNHWYRNHLNGQFECNLIDDCAQVTDNRIKMKTHQQTAHHTYSKHFHCTHPGCSATFAFISDLKLHQLTHLDGKPFHCNWPQCNHCTNKRANLVIHIRTKHFGLPATMQEQKSKNIVDLRDPNEYVRVVVDE